MQHIRLRGDVGADEGDGGFLLVNREGSEGKVRGKDEMSLEERGDKR